MGDLTPVRIETGDTLVLVDAQGVEHTVDLPALRLTLGRAGTTEVPTDPQRKEQVVESSLRPRDIQARIRAGEAPEDVAAVAGTSVEKVMIFATPVLAERAHVARSALEASVRRSTPDAHAPAVATARTLGSAAATRLRDEGLDPETVTWDAWRREDGRWTLQAAYHHGGDRQARYSYDQRGHFVQADDDDARWLVADGKVPARTTRRPEAEPGDHIPGLRLAPPYVDQELYDGSELGDDALDLVAGDPSVTVSEADPVPARRTQRPAAPAAEERSGTEDTAEVITPDDVSVSPAADAKNGADVTPTEDVAPADPHPTNVPAPRRSPAKKNRGRASVPSWDEIMFGGGS